MKTFLLVGFLALASAAMAEAPAAGKPTIYNPAADAAQDVKNAVSLAKREHKHVLLQIGGNWCGWCIKLHDTVRDTPDLQSQMDQNFIVVHVNFSKENENQKLLADLGYPQRFGFPVLVVLDGEGKRLHTQDSAYLEEGSGHSVKKVSDFLKKWSPSALDPKTYVKKT